MVTVSGISTGDADVARGLLATAADSAVSTGARVATSVAKRAAGLEDWTFKRVEDAESLLALLEDHRRHGTLGPDKVHAVDRLIASLTAACRA